MSIMSLKMLETGKISVVVWEILEKLFNHEVYREEKVSYVYIFFFDTDGFFLKFLTMSIQARLTGSVLISHRLRSRLKK